MYIRYKIGLHFVKILLIYQINKEYTQKSELKMKKMTFKRPSTRPGHRLGVHGIGPQA